MGNDETAAVESVKRERPRVCAAVVRGQNILMVRHEHSSLAYWTLPGGGLEPGESPREAAAREVLEETGLVVLVGDLLFERRYSLGVEQCFWAEEDGQQEAKLGADPEERHLPADQQMLRDVAWLPLDSLVDDVQVVNVIRAMESQVKTQKPGQAAGIEGIGDGAGTIGQGFQSSGVEG